MKLPRWVVRVMLGLSGTATLVAAAWWWFGWPTFTANEFVLRLNQGDNRAWEFVGWSEAQQEQKQFEPRWIERSVVDFVRGRRRFWLDGIAYGLCAERSEIRWGNEWGDVVAGTRHDAWIQKP